MDEIEIQITESLSVDEYNYLRKQVGWEKKNPIIVEKAIKNSTIVKKAMDSNCAVGMARAIGDGMAYFLVDVVVDPKFQKKGIGKKLVTSIIEEIKANGMAGEYSTMSLISIKGMEKFYENCGFQSVPFDYNGNGMRIKIAK